jgi:benzoyl-CoA reductase/2-hydroxyglutaryl-CoA dehydratase subunit BcrC/BadD/HgdB
LEDPIYALARRYLTSPASPRMSSWDRQAEQLIEWVKEFNVDGILGLPLTWCYLQKYRVPFLIEVLHDAGIPNMWFDREYHLANTGQLRTRIEAFLETLS